MHLTTERRGGALVVQATESRLDAAVAIAFKEAMHAATTGPETRVVLDLSSVEFLDSSGLGAVVSVMKHLGAGRQLELAGLTPPVAKVFRLTRMDTVFLIHPSLPAAGGEEGTITPFAAATDPARRRPDAPVPGAGAGGPDPDRPARIHAG
jgi:anti-sigma B factor antagonist